MCWFHNFYGYLDVSVSMRRWLKNRCGVVTRSTPRPIQRARLRWCSRARRWAPPPTTAAEAAANSRRRLAVDAKAAKKRLKNVPKPSPRSSRQRRLRSRPRRTTPDTEAGRPSSSCGRRQVSGRRTPVAAGRCANATPCCCLPGLSRTPAPAPNYVRRFTSLFLSE